MSTPENPPAFPVPMVEGWSEGAPGMTLRDWFAGQALGGMHSRDMFDAVQSTPQQRAHLAYIDADAMLAARGAS